MNSSQKFFGRKEEINEISSIFKKNNFQTYLIYGRRRIGKTELISHCAISSKKKYLYILCQDRNEELNIRVLTDSLNELFPETKNLIFRDFYSILSYVFQLSLKEEFIFFIDEYPYLKSSVESIDTIIMGFIEKYRHESKMKLVLSGSYINTMRELIDNKSPFYGRFPINRKLESLDYYDSSLFYPNATDEDKVIFYTVFGGIPYYLNNIDSSLSAKDNIIQLLNNHARIITNEVEHNISKEISNMSDALLVFSLLLSGVTHFNDLLSKSNIKSPTSLKILLEKLMNMELIEKIYPINAKNDNKKSYYQTIDPFCRFYAHYLMKNLSPLQILSPTLFYSHYIEHDLFSNYVPHCFEKIAKQYIIRKNKEGFFNPIFIDIGKYYYDLPKLHQNGEFDLVGEREDGYVFFECKYKKYKVTDSVVKEEKEQIKKTNLKCIAYGFFSKSGFDLKEESVEYKFTLNDLYN